MRTNIVIDDDLMEQARQAAGLTTFRATVDAALRLLVATRSQANFRKLRGKVQWEGDLEQSRASRGEEPPRR